MKQIVHKLLSKIFGIHYTNFVIFCKYTYYRYVIFPKVMPQVSKKSQINVVFFVIDISMWKAEGLFKLLLKDPRYNPIIVSFLYPNQSIEHRQRIQQEMEDYFLAKGYPFQKGYNFETNQWYDAMNLDPDIIFFNQPYNTGHPVNKIEHFWHKCLFIFIPYAFDVDSFQILYQTLLYNISWKVFAPNIEMLDHVSTFLFNKARNFTVTGSYLFDEIRNPLSDPWPKRNNMKRIIWAPHHSIKSEDPADFSIGYATFLTYADEMLAIAKKYQDTCLFAFKPHPLLRDKLYRQSTWGVARTDTYFQQWEALPNTIIEEGAYSALFCHSDAMIHDSCSFIADYMYTNNPVMFLANDRKYIESTLNSYGLECFNLHYHGDSTNDIMNFIERIVIAGNDPLKTKRSSMVEETFAGAKISVAEKMKLEIDQLL